MQLPNIMSCLCGGVDTMSWKWNWSQSRPAHENSPIMLIRVHRDVDGQTQKVSCSQVAIRMPFLLIYSLRPAI